MQLDLGVRLVLEALHQNQVERPLIELQQLHRLDLSSEGRPVRICLLSRVGAPTT